MMSSDSLIKLSALYLHIMLGIFMLAIMKGYDSDVMGRMFEVTMWGALLNLGVVSGNKFLQGILDKMSMGGMSFTTTTVSKTTKDTKDASDAS